MKVLKKTTIRFRKDYKLKIPDAIIAATANYLNLPILTADYAFKSITELTTILYSH
jgi:predicted nucleic acid-binding protein